MGPRRGGPGAAHPDPDDTRREGRRDRAGHRRPAAGEDPSVAGSDDADEEDDDDDERDEEEFGGEADPDRETGSREAPAGRPGAPYRYEARAIKKLAREQRRQLGIFRPSERGGGTILPIDRKQLREWRVERGDEGEAAAGELVRFDVARRGRLGLPSARVVEGLGNPADQRRISLIAIAAHGLPDVFPDRVEAELARLPALDRRHRTDLTGLPLVTIDPVDARDHDDAVHAEGDTSPGNEGGHVVTVAIADVAHYVQPGSALDREALLRGNSVYFPDRVVPMLPELISNDLCSLKEGELRPCLAVRMVFDRNGRKRSHGFVRGLMRSVAKLSYQEAQAAIDGRPNERTGPLLEPVLKPLYAAYAALAHARDMREPLELDLPERRIEIGPDGRVARVTVPERLDAHRLIEEMMIQANVAAAETLEAKRTPLVYRVHAEPSKEKLAALRDFLETLEVSLAKSQQVKPGQFNRVLERAKGSVNAELVNEVVLRAQSQAEYSPGNYGHFGLNLSRYAHFTSPIRRYADLVVHRALIRALKLGEGGLTDPEIERLDDIATQISEAERRAMAAERETADRLIAAHLADRIGAEFVARISGVTRSGLFVRLQETGADGFIAISTLGADYFHYDEDHHALTGERSGQTFRLGDTVEVRLVEAIPTAGALRFEMLSEGRPERSLGQRRPRGPGRGRRPLRGRRR
ncbi:MAG: ribonuclease R [Hyphomicrobiaceae bacterium]